RVAQFTGEYGVFAISQPVVSRFADAHAARAVQPRAAGRFTKPIQQFQPEGGDQAARVDCDELARVRNAKFGEGAGFAEKGRRGGAHRGAEVSLRAFGSECSRPELGEGVSAAVGQFDVVARLAATAIPDDEVGTELAGQVIDRGPLAL